MSTSDAPADVTEGESGAYDRIAKRWQEARRRSPRGHLDELIGQLVAPLPAGAAVLDVGCGCGEPIARALVERGLAVTGFDASPRLVALAREAVPGARFEVADLRDAEPGGPFAAAVSWDVLFHLPRGEHAAALARLRSWLAPGGRLLLSLGGSGHPGFVEPMLGETIFYSGHEPDEARRLVEAAGFRVERWELDDPSSRGHLAAIVERIETRGDAASGKVS